jgi:DNA-directed RNA polymerase specialized sigma24 family protein
LDRERWEREVAAHYGQVLRGLIAVAGRRERAEDALHDALLAALRPGVVEGIERADAWLYAVGMRKLRRATWRNRLEVLLGAGAGSYPEPGLERVEAMGLLARLTPRQRELVVARFYLDLSFKEIAEHFGLSVSGATSTVSQALARLREADLGREDHRCTTLK